MFIFQSFSQQQKSGPYGSIAQFKSDLARVNLDADFRKELIFQSMDLKTKVNGFVLEYTGKDLSVAEKNLERGVRRWWSSGAEYPNASQVASSILSQLSPQEKLVYDQIRRCLVESGFTKEVGGKFAEQYTTFAAFILTKHASAYKNPPSGMSPSEERKFQSQYVESAFKTEQGAINVLAEIKSGNLSSLLSPFGGESGLASSLSSLLSGKGPAGALREGIGKSYEAFKAYKEYVAANPSASQPLAAGGKAKTEFFT